MSVAGDRIRSPKTLQLSSVNILISENHLVTPGKEPHLPARSSVNGRWNNVSPLPHYNKLALRFLPFSVGNQGELWDPIKPASFWQKGAILWSEVAHSCILGSILVLVNLAFFTSCFAYPCLCSLFNSLFATTKSLDPISICNTSVFLPSPKDMFSLLFF